MGSPIESWDGAAAYFTGAGGGSLAFWLILAVALVIVPIVRSARHETKAYAALHKT